MVGCARAARVRSVAPVERAHQVIIDARAHGTGSEHAPAVADAPNDLWTADFKASTVPEIRALLSLTIAAIATRLVLTCHGLRSTQCEMAKPVFRRAYREYGLPREVTPIAVCPSPRPP